MTETLLLLASLCAHPVTVQPGPYRPPEVTSHPYVEYAPGVVLVFDQKCLAELSAK